MSHLSPTITVYYHNADLRGSGLIAGRFFVVTLALMISGLGGLSLDRLRSRKPRRTKLALPD
jgi:hypothetical protein